MQWDERLCSWDTLEFEFLSRNYIVQFEPMKVPAGPRHQIAPPHMESELGWFSLLESELGLGWVHPGRVLGTQDSLLSMASPQRPV